MSILKERLLVHQVLKITEQEQLFLSHEFIGYHKNYHFTFAAIVTLLFLRLKTIAFLVPFFSMVINAIALKGNVKKSSANNYQYFQIDYFPCSCLSCGYIVQLPQRCLSCGYIVQLHNSQSENVFRINTL